MGIFLFFVLAVAVAAVLVYPLLPGRGPAVESQAAAGPTWSDRQIESAVQRIRQARQQGALACPDCGLGYQPGDRFCVRCGAELPLPEGTAAGGRVCPSCGAVVRPDELFCARCGHRLAVQEAN
ncbi:MAG: zinc ribbon domain-containing protein [Anaerolineae bacterium]